jgi:hypothetical protein
VIDDVLELDAGRPAVLQLKIREAAKVGRPELGGWRAIVVSDLLQQFTNIQNYRRHEVRGTLSQFFDIGRSSHAVKAGAGYEFGEEMFNRVVNGWGSIVNITQNNVQRKTNDG